MKFPPVKVGDRYIMAVGVAEVVVVGERISTVRWTGPDGKLCLSKIETEKLRGLRRSKEDVVNC